MGLIRYIYSPTRYFTVIKKVCLQRTLNEVKCTDIKEKSRTSNYTYSVTTISLKEKKDQERDRNKKV